IASPRFLSTCPNRTAAHRAAARSLRKRFAYPLRRSLPGWSYWDEADVWLDDRHREFARARLDDALVIRVGPRHHDDAGIRQGLVNARGELVRGCWRL